MLGYKADLDENDLGISGDAKILFIVSYFIMKLVVL
jgi:hypothetical protein